MTEPPPTRLCPHCGERIRMDAARCPYCGTDFETGERPPLDTSSVATPSGALLGCGLTAVTYFFVGALFMVSRSMLHPGGQAHASARAVSQYRFWVTHGAWIGFLLPVALTGLFYLLLRRRFPQFARGLGYSCLVAAAITLGAPFLCR